MKHEASPHTPVRNATLRTLLVGLLSLLILAASLGCKEEVPIEDRALAFIQQVTRVLTENENDPEKATSLINTLTQENEPLLKELRAIDRKEKSGKDAHEISEEAEARLQAAIDALMKAAMKEKIMKHKPLHEALKNVFQ